jgi:hypothetical protein
MISRREIGFEDVFADGKESLLQVGPQFPGYILFRLLMERITDVEIVCRSCYQFHLTS